MKVAINTSFGSSVFPSMYTDTVEEEGGTSFIRSRIDFAKYIESLEFPFIKEGSDDFNYYIKRLKKGTIPYVLARDSKGEDTLALFTLANKYTVTVWRVVEVKESKHWRISDYDGEEYIEYFSGVVYLDKEIGYATW